MSVRLAAEHRAARWGLAWCFAAVAPAAQAAGELPAPLQRWLAAHPVVRFAPERDYGPFVFQGPEGEVAGLSVDMLKLVQQRTGLKLQTLPARPLQEQLAAARRGEADLITSLRPTAERGAYLAFTRPYVSVPAVVAVREGAELGVRGDAATPDALAQLQGRPVAVGAGYAVEAAVRRSHPQVRWQPVPDDRVALQGVVAGRFDAAVLDAASLAYIVREDRLRGLVAIGRVGFDYPLSFAVRRDWPELRDLLDFGIQSLSAAERQQVLDRWMPPDEAPAAAPRATRLALALIALAALVALAALWRRRRGRRP